MPPSPVAIAAVCAERGVRTLAVPPGLRAEWRPAVVELVEDHGLTARKLDEVDGALTGCTAAGIEPKTILGAAAGSRGAAVGWALGGSCGQFGYTGPDCCAI